MTRRVWGLVGLIGTLVLFSASVEARPKRRSRQRVRKVRCPKGLVRMRVTHASHAHLFFARGSAEGLAVGTSARLYRRGRRAGQCEIEVGAAHNARCAHPDGSQPDTACYKSAAASAAESIQWQAGPGHAEASAKEQSDLRQTLATEGLPKVVDEGTPVTGALSVRADAALEHVTFMRVRGPSGTTHRQQIYASARNINLGFFDTRASIDLSVLAYLDRPEQVRFRSENSALLYVHETAISRRSSRGGLVIDAGRLRPRNAPGVAYLDGAQVGFRFSEHLELGVLGGGLPDLVRLKPSTSRWMAGGYGRWAMATSALRWDVSGRAGLVHDDLGATQGEVAAWTRLGVGRSLVLSTGGRAYAGSQGLVLASLRGRIDMRPADDWHLSLDGRMRDDGPDPYAAGIATVGARHARANLDWRGLRWLTVGLDGGYGELYQDDLTRVVVGPQVGMPRLLGAYGGLWFGYQEALGWLPGRRAWTQVRLHPHRALRLWLRASYRQDHHEAGVLREVGGFAQADWQLSNLLRLRGSVFSRLGLYDLGALGSGAAFVGRVSLIAAL